MQILPEPENLLAVGHALHHAPLGPSTGMAARSFAVISLQKKAGHIICIELDVSRRNRTFLGLLAFLFRSLTVCKLYKLDRELLRLTDRGV